MPKLTKKEELFHRGAVLDAAIRTPGILYGQVIEQAQEYFEFVTGEKPKTKK